MYEALTGILAFYAMYVLIHNIILYYIFQNQIPERIPEQIPEQIPEEILAK